jgi:hypothetical protein
MLSQSVTTALAAFLSVVPIVNAHIGVWHPSMFCANGPQSEVDWNANTVVSPLYELDFSDFWFGNGQTNGVSNKCYNWPPPAGEFLELPAGGSFEIEMANNRAFTSMSEGGSKNVGTFPDGQTHADYDVSGYNNPQCITQPLLHTMSKADVAGSAFAISYESEYSNVTPENMAVFSVAYGTPWHTKASFDVPADMPACPDAGCLCGWGWVPNNCGQPNMYLQLFRCKVTGAKANAPAVAPAKAAVWCQDDQENCTKGAKQLVVWHQNERNNIAFTGVGRAGEEDDLQQFSPGYNTKLGFQNGAQNDIFVNSPQSVASSSKAASSTTTMAPSRSPVVLAPIGSSSAKPSGSPVAKPPKVIVHAHNTSSSHKPGCTEHEKPKSKPKHKKPHHHHNHPQSKPRRSRMA